MEPFISEPVRGTIGDLTPLKLSGLEAMRRAVRGEAPPPPMHHLIGLTPTEVGLGTATFVMPVTPWLEDSVGVIWGGTYALLADAPISTALYTGLPPGKTVSTSELSINYLRPATIDSRQLVGRGRSVYLGRTVGVSEATIEDSKGRIMAHATTRCVIQDVPFDPDAELAEPPPFVDDPPDPYLRAVPSTLQDHVSIWDGDRLKVQQSLPGRGYSSPVQVLTGLEFLGVEEGRSTSSLTASPWFSVGSPMMYGGVLAWACDNALTGAVWSTLDAESIGVSLDFQVRFLRPVPLDGSRLDVNGEILHRGRSIRVSQAEVTNSAGKTVAIASGSSMVVPGGIDQLSGRKAEDLAASLGAE